jgi:hypothetical protein
MSRAAGQHGQRPERAAEPAGCEAQPRARRGWKAIASARPGALPVGAVLRGANGGDWLLSALRLALPRRASDPWGRLACGGHHQRRAIHSREHRDDHARSDRDLVGRAALPSSPRCHARRRNALRLWRRRRSLRRALLVCALRSPNHERARYWKGGGRPVFPRPFSYWGNIMLRHVCLAPIGRPFSAGARETRPGRCGRLDFLIQVWHRTYGNAEFRAQLRAEFRSSLRGAEAQCRLARFASPMRGQFSNKKGSETSGGNLRLCATK